MTGLYRMLIGIAAVAVCTACTDEFMDTRDVPLVAARVSAVSLSKNVTGSVQLRDTTLLIGDTTSLLVTVRDRLGRDATKNVRLNFFSRDTTVVTVGTLSGIVTVQAFGKTFLVVRASNGFRDSVLVRVERANVPKRDSVLVSAPKDPAPVPVSDTPATSGTEPTLPRAQVSTASPDLSGRVTRVAAGDTAGLRRALNAATAGDEIVLPNNSEFVGSFALPVHAGSGVVVLRSETVPAPGVRVTPATAAGFARIVTRTVLPAIGTAPGAKGWRVIGVSAIQQNDAIDNYGIVRLGSGSEAALPEFVSDIVLDRVYVSAGARGSTRRCVGMNGASLGVINSWLADCHARGFDAQAVGAWTGTGPFLIENNHLEASSEVIAFGGADPKVRNMSPSDITIRGNYLYRPMAWANAGWLIKNTFELKHAKRLLFENNVLENNWIDGQVGYAILFQAISQDGLAPWTSIQDITVRNNIIRNSTSGVYLLSRREWAGVMPSEPSQRILFQNNLFQNVGKDPVSGASGRILQLIGDMVDLTIASNTFYGGLPTDAAMLDGTPQVRFTMINNVFQASTYGLMGAAVGEGNVATAKFAPGGVVKGNVFTGRQERFYPSGNTFPTSLTPSTFANASAGDFTYLSPNVGGTRPGVNGTALLAATARAIVR